MIKEVKRAEFFTSRGSTSWSYVFEVHTVNWNHGKNAKLQKLYITTVFDGANMLKINYLQKAKIRKKY